MTRSSKINLELSTDLKMKNLENLIYQYRNFLFINDNIICHNLKEIIDLSVDKFFIYK